MNYAIINFRFRPFKNELVKNAQAVLEIHDHSVSPFKQYTKFYEEENITEITVQAHNDYEQNTFFLLHDSQLRVAVLGDHTCKFSDIFAYDFDNIRQSKLN